VSDAASAVGEKAKGFFNNIKNAIKDKVYIKSCIKDLKGFQDRYNGFVANLETNPKAAIKDIGSLSQTIHGLIQDIKNDAMLKSYLSNEFSSSMNAADIGLDTSVIQTMIKEYALIQEALFGNKRKQQNTIDTINLDLTNVNNVGDVIHKYEELYDTIYKTFMKYNNGLQNEMKKGQENRALQQERIDAKKQHDEQQKNLIQNISGRDQERYIADQTKRYNDQIMKIKSEAKTPEDRLSRLQALLRSANTEIERWKTGKNVVTESYVILEYFNDAIVAAFEKIARTISNEISEVQKLVNSNANERVEKKWAGKR
jgi:hypothetical protein